MIVKLNNVVRPTILPPLAHWRNHSLSKSLHILFLVAVSWVALGADYQFYTDAGLQTNGLTGSYVDQNLRTAPAQPDWRITYPISGTRVDPQINFDTLTWGNLAAVGITGAFDSNFGWENFSVQWDGYVKILTNDVLLATQSDDSSRMWIDVNQDGVFSSGNDELMNNNWGTSHAETVGTFSPPLATGVYRIRIQYQEDYFGNSMKIASDRLGSYRDIGGNLHFLEELRGKYTRLLLTKEDLIRMSLPQARELLDQQDILYAQLKELTGGEPAGAGLLTVAFVETCGAGCGYIGAKGVEIDPDFAGKTTEETYDFVAHEMTHNFDTLSSYFFIGNDTGHAWTAWIQNYLDMATMHGSGPRSPENYQAFRVKELFTYPYLEIAGHSWNSCVKSNAYCGGLDTHLIQAGFCHKVSALHGVAAVQRALGFIRTAIVSRNLNPGSMSPEQRNDLMLEAFSFGAQTNLTCFADTWNWALSSTLRSNLVVLYGNNNSLCSDSDGDGYSVIQGDFSDNNASVHPGAAEIVNGLDDNCNGVIDETTIEETGNFPNSPQTSLGVVPPARIKGTGNPSRADFFHLDTTNTTVAHFALSNLGIGTGWLAVRNPDGSLNHYAYVPPQGTISAAVALIPGRSEFDLSLNSGQYEILLALDAAWPPYEFASTPQLLGTNLWALTASAIPTSLASGSDVSVRHWISGQGWIATNNVNGPASILQSWTAPTNFPTSSATYRSQYFTNNIAATRLTEARAFEPRVAADLVRAETNGLIVRFAGNRAPKAVQWQSTDLISWTPTKTNQPFLNVWTTTNGLHLNRALFRLELLNE